MPKKIKRTIICRIEGFPHRMETVMALKAYEGGCMCGAIRFVAEGEPLRVGLCHCTACRRNTGTHFAVFAIWGADQVHVEGQTAFFRSSDKGERHFCGRCGAPLFYAEPGERAIHVGAFDDPDHFRPTYELWAKRRVGWLPIMAGVERYPEDRPSSGRSPDPRPASE